MSSRFGRFTVRGSDAVEALMTALVNEAADAVQSAFAPKEYRALLMIGGYGRGEGGVVRVNGEERPHNNLDFLLVVGTLSQKKQAALRGRLVQALQPVMQKYQIEIDVSVVSTWKLRFSPSLIIWYDARFGHNTILGDADYMPAQKHFRVDRIPPRDALRLLVNRGTLLLINEHILESGEVNEEHRQRIVRNTMKAIIGYGDALLFFLGDYHWSYVERKRRMQMRHDIDPEFGSLYDEAAEFRLQPNYKAYVGRDLRAWMAGVRTKLEPIHRFCEEMRLGVQDLDWQDYPKHALAHALFDECLSARGWARKALHGVRSTQPPLGLGLQAQLGYHSLGPRGHYPIAFPIVAYHLQDSRLKDFAAAALGAKDGNELVLSGAYLHTWGSQGDINFRSSLRKWRMQENRERADAKGIDLCQKDEGVHENSH